MYSQTIAAADPAPFNKPRFIRWPSVCDTTRTNWLNPSAEPCPPAPVPGAETFSIDAGCHLHVPPLQPGQPLPAYLQNTEMLCTPVATVDQQAAFASYTLSADAFPTPLPPDLRAAHDSTIDCGPAIPIAPLPTPPAPPKRKRKRCGRPTSFDETARARFCGMIESGATIRYAAKRLGIDRRTVRYACRTDPAFADRLRRAEQDRDQAAIGRIHNAGEKSWRAAAWLLERIAPQEFSLRHGPASRSEPKKLAKRQFEQLVAAVSTELAQTKQPPSAESPVLPQPHHRRLTDEAIEAKIVELLEPLNPNERFDLMYRLGY
jgi:hypothetical protein